MVVILSLSKGGQLNDKLKIIYLAKVDLHRYPFLRLLLPFIVGILFNYYFVIPYPVILIGFTIFFAFVLYSVFAKSKQQSILSFSIPVGIAVYLALFFAGNFSAYQSNSLNNNNHLSYKNNYDRLLVRVLSPPEQKAKTYKIIASVEQIYTSNTNLVANGKVLLYINKKSFDSTIKYGDYLIIKNKLKPPPNAIGIDSFNYAKWLTYKNIYHQGFLWKGDYIKTELNRTNTLFAFSFTARNYFDEILHYYLPDSATYGVASAIVLGLKTNLDKELIQAYAHSGTIHILAVSGLHVGAIYFAIAFLLSLFGNSKWTNIIKVIVILSCLWLYALITGLSPSVVRATIMFSFIAIGNGLGRKTNLFNSLAAAALFTLAFDAKAIFQVGFQLSYLAVAGIGLLYLPLKNLLTPKTWLLGKVWQLLCVSFAAQIATTPLAIYYFHQFPNHFLVANLFIVPLAMLAVYIGLLLLLIATLPFIPAWVGKVMHLVISTNNSIVQTIEGLPFAYTSNLYLNEWSVLVIYSSILSLFLYLKTKKPQYLICLLTLLITLTILI